jgi:DNA repair exonuclease SbcCD ATPase subunit
MITFTKLRWKNFLSTGNIFTEINLNSHATTLIVGKNGSGKTTILDALSFALFGKPFRKINKPQLVNSIIEKGLVVELEFHIGKTRYKIIRGIKPSVFELYQNDKLLNQTAETKDYQEILERQIIRVNHKSFCQVVILGTASFVPFMQLTAGQRREIIEDLLDLQIFTTMNSILKDRISDNNSNITECNNNITLTNERIDLVRNHLIRLQNDNEKIIEEKKERVIESDKRLDILVTELKEVNDNINNLQKKVTDYDKLKKSLFSMDKLTHQIEAKISVLTTEIKFLNNHDNCPTCKQEIEDTFKCESISIKNKEIEETQDGLNKLTEKYNKTKKQIDGMTKINDQIIEEKMQAHKIITRINSIQEYKDNLINEINSFTSSVSIGEEADKIITYEKLIEEYSEQYILLQNNKTLLACAATLLKDTGIKSKIIKQYVPIINKLINKYLSSMEFMCQFELDENFNEKIKSRFRDVFSYDSFSEGEKFRINLAILFTWRAVAKRRNSINTNILIMDEVMDSSLDNDGMEEFLKLINGLTKDTNTFIISHKQDAIVDKFDNVIRFEKHQNFSRVA